MLLLLSTPFPQLWSLSLTVLSGAEGKESSPQE